MIDVNLIRKNPEYVRENLKRRGDPEILVLLDEFIEADKAWRLLQTEMNEYRRRRNELGYKIAARKKRGLDVTD
ncbi:MAG: seryl-tRNA synthetase, partial [Candidatus Bathyarchaeota archaeon B63]